MHVVRTRRTLLTIIVAGLGGLAMTAGPAFAAGPWVVVQPRPGAWRFTAAAWGDGRYVGATADGILAVSLDGGAWRPVVADAHWNIRKMGFGPGGFIAAGTYEIDPHVMEGLILRSPDGITWSEAVRSVQLDDPAAVALSSGAWYVFGRTSVWTSPEGSRWTSQPLAFDRDLVAIRGATSWNGRWVAVGSVYDGSQGFLGWIGASDDGVTWRTVATPARPLTCLAVSPSALVAGGEGIVAWSDDGAAWTVESLPGGVTSVNDCIWTGSRFVAAASESPPGAQPKPGAMLVSTDGRAWSYAVIDPFAARLGFPAWSPAAVAQSPWGLVALGHGTVLASADGKRWNHRVFGMSCSFDQVVDLAGAPLVLETVTMPPWSNDATEHQGLTSGDGIDWALSEVPITVLGRGWRFVARDGQLFGFRPFKDRSVAVLDPGGAWHLGSLPAGGVSTPAGAAWGPPGIVVVETGGVIDFSPDGLSWSTRIVPGLWASWKNVVWTGSMYMAVGGQGEVAASTDGLAWTVRQGPGVLVDTGAVASNGSVTVAAGGFGALAWTVDGRQWSHGPRLTDEDLNDVRWTGGRFITTGDAGTVLASMDGRTWTREPAPPLAVDLRGAADVDGRLAVIGSGETIQIRLPSVPDIADPPAFRCVVPAAAHVRGANQSFWTTDLVLTNTHDRAVIAWLRLVPDSGPVETRPVIVGRAASLMFRDVLAGVFGREDGRGALLVDSDTPLEVTSRTAADASGTGPGQVLPGIPVAAAGVSVILPGLAGAPAFRTNIGFANLGPDSEHAVIELRSASGQLLARRTRDLGPWRWMQLNRVLDGLSAAGGAWARVTADGPFTAYASVVDNGTNDAATVLPAVASSDPVVIPAAAHTSGFNGAVWRSDLDLINPGGGDAQVRIELLPPGGGAVDGGTVRLGPGTGVRLVDVLGSRFPGHDSGAIRIVPLSGSVAAWSRTFNVAGGGTLGQGIPAVAPPAAGLDSSGKLTIAGLRGGPSASEWFHTNIGLVNLSDAPARLIVKIDGGAGTSDERIVVPADGWLQLLKIFGRSMVAPVVDGTVTVISEDGETHVVAWASVVSDTSGDPSFLLARP